MADRARREIYAKMRGLEVGQFVSTTIGDAEESRPYRQTATYLGKTFGVVFAVHYDFKSGKLTITRTK